MLEDAAGIRRVVLACGTVDLRKGIDGPATVVLKKVQQKLHFLLFKDYLIINNVFLSHKTGKDKKYVQKYS